MPDYNDEFLKSMERGEKALEEWAASCVPEPDSGPPLWVTETIPDDLTLDFEKNGGTGGTGGTSLIIKEKSCSPNEISRGTEGTEPKIPTEPERPCYRVFDQPFETDAKKYRAGVWFFWVQVGKGKEAEITLAEKWICTPLYMDAVTRDIQDNNFGRLLRFKNTLGRWREWAMPMELLKGSAEELRGELLSMGVQIDPAARNELSRYLQSITPKRRIHCTLQIGWHSDCFVLPDRVIGEKSDAVVFQSGDRGRDEHTVGGTLESWRLEVAAMAIGNPLMMLGLSAAFGGPLLAKCNAEGGGIHFYGDSSTGKTTIVDAACSVWGGRNYKRSWRATANGIEGAAQLFNDCLLALDEISECEPREISKIVYAIGNGYGKQRASRSGAARDVARWRCFVLSSGERATETALFESGIRAKAGQEIRLLNIPASGTFGAFDDLHGFSSGAALSDEIKPAAARNHGYAGREFLERLTRESRNISGLFEQVKALLSSDTADGQEKRAAARFALVALAGELATEYGITGWPEGAAIKAAQVGLELWVSNRQRGNSELKKMLDQIKDHIERFGDGRFSELADDDARIRILDRSGFWHIDGGTKQFLFNGAGLKSALAGFDFRRSLKALSVVGVLPEPDAEGKISRKFRAGNQTVRLYPVTLDGDCQP